MNFIAALLSSVDAFWALLTIPAVLVGVMAFAYFLPIPTLLVAFYFVRMQFVFARICMGMQVMDDPDEAVKGRNNCLAKAYLLMLATLAGFGWHIHGIIASGDLCGKFSDYNPGTLPALLQKIVPHTC